MSLLNNGPELTIKLASFPFSRVPIIFSLFKIFAGTVVRDAKACFFVKPYEIAFLKLLRNSLEDFNLLDVIANGILAFSMTEGFIGA